MGNTLMAINNLIFDLDGTLIDSSNSILESFRGAFEKLGKTPVRPLTADVIGPPLTESLRLLSGSSDPEELDGLAEAFKAHYDAEGYKHTGIFTGIREMLAELSKRQLPLYIATNKRTIPSRLILDYLGWTPYFAGVYALDSLPLPAAQKSDLLEYIVEKHSMNPAFALYVGDRKEDWDAASKNRLNFAFAAWGYGSGTVCVSDLADFYLESPFRLLEL
jgi:phosphoglycolate phosphatase